VKSSIAVEKIIFFFWKCVINNRRHKTLWHSLEAEHSSLAIWYGAL